jgi:Omp85 superfamily domain
MDFIRQAAWLVDKLASSQAWRVGCLVAIAGALPSAPVQAQELRLPSETSSADAPVHSRRSFHDLLFDEADGQFDLSNFLLRGGFVPVPIIITEPAVEGGLGLIAQFVSYPDGNPQLATRRTIGGAYTGNGSYGYGFSQSGHAFDNRLRYSFGIGRGQINIATYPGGLDIPLDYTSSYKYGIFGSAYWILPDERFFLGPMIDFRKLDVSLNVPGDHPEVEDLLTRELTYGAVGFGVHFDDRDNPITPTKGLNTYLNAKFYEDMLGSDQEFQIYDLEAFYFHPLADSYRVGLKGSVNQSYGDVPFFFAPSVDLRGVESKRFQGRRAISTELELTKQFNDRWAALAFAGYGEADAGDGKFFSDSGSIFTGGAGFRYRIARKLGLDAGVDVAAGPDGTIVYFQFGNAWSREMD